MREMKDSDVEWVGEIPSKWRTVRFKYLTLCETARAENNDNYIGLENVESWTGRFLPSQNEAFEAEGGAIVVKKGDILFGKLRPYLAKCCIAETDGCCSTEFLVLKEKDLLASYIKYIMTSPMFIEDVNMSTYGAKMPRASWNYIGNMQIPFPSDKEQRDIISYLDTKCAKIDSIIEKQQAIIERLKEYKLSVITETVTKGLNPDVEMKDSGNKWIGCIPKHWKVSKLKYLFGTGDDSLKIGPFGSAMKGKTLESGPYKIYNQAHLIQNDFNLNRHFVSEETFEELLSYEVKPDDILFSMMGTIGKCQIMPSGYPKGIMDSHLLKARLNEKVLPQFFVYAYDKDYSSQVIQQLLYVSNGTIMNGLNSSILKNVIIALPPVNEQQEITKYLDKFIQEVDMRIAKVTKIVDKLQEYKKSLIYEVVTGKKEV